MPLGQALQSSYIELTMDLSIEVPTPTALADLVARCNQIDRYATQLAQAEEIRISQLATGVVAMRRVLQLEQVPREKLPSRHARAEHFILTSDSVRDIDGSPVSDMAHILHFVRLVSSRSNILD